MRRIIIPVGFFSVYISLFLSTQDRRVLRCIGTGKGFFTKVDPRPFPLTMNLRVRREMDPPEIEVPGFYSVGPTPGSQICFPCIGISVKVSVVMDALTHKAA